jgi:enoyl-CoA hydratase/carnithine racemase
MPAVEYQEDGHIALITINRPESMNSINREVMSGLLEAFTRFRDNRDLRVSILTGIGDRAFSAGADLKEATEGGTADRTPWEPLPTGIHYGMELWKPVIAAVNGYCLGGGLELALSCDIRIGSENSSYGLPEVSRGIIPGGGGTQRLTRIIGLGEAMELLLTGRRIDAQEALRLGLVTHVVPLENLIDKAKELASEIAENAPLSIQASKEAAMRGLNTTLQEGLRIEQWQFALISQTEDAKEGPLAFVEKRAPNYQGH